MRLRETGTLSGLARRAFGRYREKVFEGALRVEPAEPMALTVAKYEPEASDWMSDPTFTLIWPFTTEGLPMFCEVTGAVVDGFTPALNASNR